MRTVYPTYDRDHYIARAMCYGRAAEHEPDPVIREALLTAERECRRHRGQRHECRRRAESTTNRALLEC